MVTEIPNGWFQCMPACMERARKECHVTCGDPVELDPEPKLPGEISVEQMLDALLSRGYRVALARYGDPPYEVLLYLGGRYSEWYAEDGEDWRDGVRVQYRQAVEEDADADER